MAVPDADASDLLKEILGPLLDDFKYWFERSVKLLERDDLDRRDRPGGPPEHDGHRHRHPSRRLHGGDDVLVRPLTGDHAPSQMTFSTAFGTFSFISCMTIDRQSECT